MLRGFSEQYKGATLWSVKCCSKLRLYAAHILGFGNVGLGSEVFVSLLPVVCEPVAQLRAEKETFAGYGHCHQCHYTSQGFDDVAYSSEI